LLRAYIWSEFLSALLLSLFTHSHFHRPTQKVYWLYAIQITKEHPHTYGTLPNKSTFDPDWQRRELKLQMIPRIRSVLSLMMIILFGVCSRISCTSSIPVVALNPPPSMLKTLLWELLRKALLKTSPSERKLGKALLLCNPVQNAENTKKKTFSCPFSSDPLSCYQTTLKLIAWCPLHCGGGPRRIFQKKAVQAELSEWKEAGLT
jgi:hypothetical protein